MAGAAGISQPRVGFLGKIGQLTWTDEQWTEFWLRSLPPVVCEAEVLPALEAALTDWNPVAEAEEDEEECLQLATRRDAACAAWVGADRPRTLDGLLEYMVSGDQIDWAMEHCFESSATRAMDPRCSRALLARQLYLWEDCEPVPVLELYTSVNIKSLRIPDPARDEIVIDYELACGTSVDRLFEHMICDGIMTAEEAAETRKAWTRTDAYVYPGDELAYKVERYLKVQVTNAIESQERNVSYNIGPKTGRIWRITLESATVPTHFDLSLYPFDTQMVYVTLQPFGPFDSATVVLVPDEYGGPSLGITNIETPRGFGLQWAMRDLNPVAFSVAVDHTPDSMLRFGLALHRRPSTFLWRTLAPSLLVLILVLVAGGTALFSGNYTESVMTQAVPGILVAFVALQLTAAQSVPAHSGRTLEDLLFLVYYSVLLLLFLSLELRTPEAPSFLSYVCFGTALLLFLGCISFYAVMAAKALSARDRAAA